MNEITFEKLPIGNKFKFHGKEFEKVALSMAEDADRNGSVLMTEAVMMVVELGSEKGSQTANIVDQS